MFEIVVSLCLFADPTACKEERLPFVVPSDNPARCSVVSAPLVAEWAGRSPGWQLVRWRCATAGERRT